jgi:hypothetical protein
MGVNDDSSLFYSISSDASNKGARKIPWSSHSLIKTTERRLVDFYEDDYEDSLAIFKAISKSLDELKLSRDMITAYSAHNASVNYGQYNSAQRILGSSKNVSDISTLSMQRL